MNHPIIDIPEYGKYAIHLKTLKKDADEASAMANYLSQMAVINKRPERLTISLLFQSERTITGFQVENTDGVFLEAIEKQVNDEMERRFEMFKIDKLPTILNARVQYEVEHEGKSFKGDEVLRLAFNQESLEKLD